MARITLRGRAAGMSELLGVFCRVTRTGRQGYAIGVGKTEEIDQIAPGAALLEALRSGPEPAATRA
jgi:hypothetical protein